MHGGADPAESEILFAPLTGLEIVGMRTEGAVVVAEARLLLASQLRLTSFDLTRSPPSSQVRLSVNLLSPPIEKLVAKMKARDLP